MFGHAVATDTYCYFRAGTGNTVGQSERGSSPAGGSGAGNSAYFYYSIVDAASRLTRCKVRAQPGLNGIN
jgi:hypothetical protein